MRCMTAIWPAGPPKLSAATLSQTQNASPNDGILRTPGSVRVSVVADVFEVMGLVVDMVRPEVRTDAILRHVASWGDRFPMRTKKPRSTTVVKRGEIDLSFRLRCKPSLSHSDGQGVD